MKYVFFAIVSRDGKIALDADKYLSESGYVVTKDESGKIIHLNESYYNEQFRVIYDIQRGATGDARVFCVKEGDLIFTSRHKRTKTNTSVGRHANDEYAVINTRKYEVEHIRKRAGKIVCKLISSEDRKVFPYICDPKIEEE